MNDYSYENPLLHEEARSFDRQIVERVTHGHVPDLRHTGRCDYFYNNVWRDPYFADLLFGETVRQICRYAAQYLSRPPSACRVLEIACGPGHLSLELARNAFPVTGIDISRECIRTAQATAAADPYKNNRGALNFLCQDIDRFIPEQPFDLIVFSNALHHFGDVDGIIKKTSSFLSSDGLLYVSEPAKEPLSDSDAMIIHLIRTLLSLSGCYFEKQPVPENQVALGEILKKIKSEFEYKDENRHNVQSPMDNQAPFSQTYPVLKKYFTELAFQNDFSFFDRIVGGLRFENREQEHAVAQWLCLLDRQLCGRKTLAAEQYHFVGRKKAIIPSETKTENRS